MPVDSRKLRFEQLEPKRMLTIYVQNAATEFANDFVGALPQNNPNGDWAYLGPNGLTDDLEAHNDPGSVGGSGSGWRVKAAVGGGVAYAYARGGVGGFSSPPNTILGHGPMKTVWTAPVEVDMGAVEISGIFNQAQFELDRQMQLRIYKDDPNTPLVTVNAVLGDPTQVVNIPSTQVGINPGDTLTIEVDGQGDDVTGPNAGVSTFASWDVTITEIDGSNLGEGADFNGDLTVNGDDLTNWIAGYGTTSGANKSDGDADDDGDADGGDFLLWQQEFVVPPSTDYHPTAVIVQTSGVSLPDGTQLDITGTQTDGLQEAFDYAADEGWGVFVLPGTYSLDAGLDVVERQAASYRLQDVTLNFGAGVSDFGLRFDSSIIMDWYWDGGALNAPFATDGVRFDPRSLHPLDGCLGLTPPAIADGRFLFDVPITAATNEVTMDTTARTINDIYLHFQGLTKNDLNILGNGFSDTNTFLDARTDQAIPWDLFSTAGRVTVNVPDGPIGTHARVYLPDGSLLDTTGTSTVGLQEAFDHAAANDLDVLVFGRGIRNSEIDAQLPACGNTNQGLYNLGSTLNVGDLDDRMYRIFNVTFNYIGNGTALQFGDVVSSDFELTGQVVWGNGTTGVLIRPQTTPMTDSIIRVEHVPSLNDSSGTVAVHIDASLQTIENSEFYFTEILGGDTGLRVENPSASTFFRNNVLSTVHTHDWRSIGLRLGSTSTNSSNIHTNTIDIHTNTDGGPANLALQVWGNNNTITFSAAGGGAGAAAARLESASENNVVTHFAANGALIDIGTNNSFIAGLIAASDPDGDLGPFASILFADEDAVSVSASSNAGNQSEGSLPTSTADLDSAHENRADVVDEAISKYSEEEDSEHLVVELVEAFAASSQAI